MRDYRHLLAWQRAHQLVLDVYRLTQGFPKSESFGLVSQLRRSAVSIPSNIAEGAGRRSTKDFRRFLSVAAGSASELQYQLELSRDLGYIEGSSDPVLASSHEVKRLLWGLQRATTVKESD